MPVTAVRLEEPVGDDAVLGHAVQDAVGADDRRVDRPGENQRADDHHEGVQDEFRPGGAVDAHRQAADEVVPVLLHANVVGNQQHGQDADAAGEDQAVEEDDEGRPLEVLELGELDFAVDLGQGLLAAHGQDRVAEGDKDSHQPHQAQPVPAAHRHQMLSDGGVLQETQGAFRQVRARIDLGIEGGQEDQAVLGAFQPEGHAAPGEDHHGHHGRGDHDPQGLLARLVNALEVLVEEVDRGQAGDDHRAERLAVVAQGRIDSNAGEVAVGLEGQSP